MARGPLRQAAFPDNYWLQIITKRSIFVVFGDYVKNESLIMLVLVSNKLSNFDEDMPENNFYISFLVTLTLPYDL